LQKGFDRTETIIFPEWHRAGMLFQQAGIKSVTAGIYGEVLGGHYGTAMLDKGVNKIATVAAELIGWTRIAGSKAADESQDVRKLLYVRGISKPWYLKSEVLDSISNIEDDINHDIEATVRRFERCGIMSGRQLIEVFITKHRGSQYIMSQLLSCRAHTDITVPFADIDLMDVASRIPIQTKLHNALNRKILQQFAPDLLQVPCASMLVAAKYPIIFQEVSRLIRYVVEKNQRYDDLKKWHWLGLRSFSFLNFDFLRKSNVLQTMAADLQSHLWDLKAIKERLRGVNESSDMVALVQLMAKIYNVDLMLR
jgi:hypothetical protein